MKDTEKQRKFCHQSMEQLVSPKIKGYFTLSCDLALSRGKLFRAGDPNRKLASLLLAK